MLDKLLSAAATNAKLALAAAAGAALVAGGSAAVVVQNVADSTGASNASETGVENRSATATASIGKPKPATGTADITPGGVHGACVSFVAKDKDAEVDGNHGKAVSEAAKTCPKNNEDAGAATESEDADKGAAGKATAEEKKKAAEAKRSAATTDADDADEDADDDTPRGSRETGTERSGRAPK